MSQQAVASSSTAMSTFASSAMGFAVNTMVRTPSRSRRLDQLAVGDLVFDHTNRPVVVLAVGPVYVGQTLKVEYCKFDGKKKTCIFVSPGQLAHALPTAHRHADRHATRGPARRLRHLRSNSPLDLKGKAVSFRRLCWLPSGQPETKERRSIESLPGADGFGERHLARFDISTSSVH